MVFAFKGQMYFKEISKKEYIGTIFIFFILMLFVCYERSEFPSGVIFLQPEEFLLALLVVYVCWPRILSA